MASLPEKFEGAVILEPDDRGRVTLSRIPGANKARYLAHTRSDGCIVLKPAAVMTEQALESYVQARISQASRQGVEGLRTHDEVVADHRQRRAAKTSKKSA
jgi:hypothetical protein